MSSGVARLTDLFVGVCCCHCDACCIGMGGVIITSAQNTETNNLGNSRCTDIVIGFCGHPGVIVTCSDTVITENLGQARCGDIVAGPCLFGTIITCSTDTYSD